MSEEEKNTEFEKCKKSPYYFANKYLTTEGNPYSKILSEEDFNRVFGNSSDLNVHITFNRRRQHSRTLFYNLQRMSLEEFEKQYPSIKIKP